MYDICTGIHKIFATAESVVFFCTANFWFLKITAVAKILHKWCTHNLLECHSPGLSNGDLLSLLFSSTLHTAWSQNIVDYCIMLCYHCVLFDCHSVYAVRHYNGGLPLAPDPLLTFDSKKADLICMCS